jgi:FkbM family methyltransferase
LRTNPEAISVITAEFKKSFRDRCKDPSVHAPAMLAERGITAVYTKFLKTYSDFSAVDGGAHVAYHTERLAVLPGCRMVFAVEADPNTFQRLVQRVKFKKLANIKSIEAALQENPRTEFVEFMSSTTQPGRSGVDCIWKDDPNFQYTKVRVAATTIDQAVEGATSPIKFIKLDLEGGEYPALLGATATLCSDRPLIASEFSIRSPKLKRFTIEEYIEFFRSIQYQPLTFFGERLTGATFSEFHYIFIVPVEHEESVQRIIRLTVLTVV